MKRTPNEIFALVFAYFIFFAVMFLLHLIFLKFHIYEIHIG